LSDLANSMKLDTNEMDPWKSTIVMGVNVLQMICSITMAITLVINTKNIGLTYWKSVWSFMDLIYCVFIFVTSMMMLTMHSLSRSLRIFESIIAVCIWWKALYYMQLIDQVSPLVSIIFKIFDDILIFVLISAILLFALANSYYLIGLN
jgi:hypothetical protein